MRHKAFALREAIALVAVVIIAGALLFPYFARSRESGHKTPGSTCRSNLKQIGLGLWQYAQDYDEKYPLAKNSAAGLESPTNWVGLLQPYLKSVQIFRCPSEQNSSENKHSSYGYNKLLNHISAEKLRHPTFTIAHFEVDSSHTASTQTGSNAKDVTASTRHDNGANYAFADGHVKWLKPESITASHKYSDEFTFAVQ